MAPSDFKVIVVGGGPVGLTAAHALHAAGINFLMLERRQEIVIDAGSNLVLSPIGLRTLAQLGLRQSIDAVSSPLGRIDRLDHKGRNLGDVVFFEQMKKKCVARVPHAQKHADNKTQLRHGSSCDQPA
jgi:2-polyprenyl-6-methoxyphenol hydroxylase-like FAD-dependent oxidoreductase